MHGAANWKKIGWKRAKIPWDSREEADCGAGALGF